MLRKALIANRGEIACRIIRTLRQERIEAVAVYHHEDRHAPHVSMADVAVELASDVPTVAYLDQAQIIDVADVNGARKIDLVTFDSSSGGVSVLLSR